MAILNDLGASGDWQYFDNRRTGVVMTSVAKGAPSISKTVGAAFRGKVRYHQLQQTNGAAVRPEASYLIPKTATNGAGPWKPGDKLRDPNETADPTDRATEPAAPTYTVQLADSDEYYWYLAVFDPKIAFGLRDLCSVLEYARAATTVGTSKGTATTILSGLTCRVQPSRSAFAVNHGRVGTNNYYDVFFADNYDIQPHKHAIVFGDALGNQLTGDVVEVNGQERIDTLMRAVVEVRV